MMTIEAMNREDCRRYLDIHISAIRVWQQEWIAEENRLHDEHGRLFEQHLKAVDDLEQIDRKNEKAFRVAQNAVDAIKRSLDVHYEKALLIQEKLTRSDAEVNRYFDRIKELRRQDALDSTIS